MSRALWEIATTGRTSLPREDGVYDIQVEGDAWFDVVKWLYQHIDGPPKQSADVNLSGLISVNFTSNVNDDQL